MKSQDLLERKRKLNEELARVGQEIAKVGQKIEADGLKNFISSGEVGKPHDIPLEKLKRRYDYLGNMAKGLNIEIAKARKAERETKAAKVQRQLNKNLTEHDRLNKKGHNMKVVLQKLSNQARVLNEEEMMLNQKLRGFKRLDYTENLKFRQDKTEVDLFVAQFYIADPKELRALVKKTRQENKHLLPPYDGARPIELKRQDAYMGYRITLDKDSGKILKTKGIPRSLSMTWTKEQIEEVT